MIALYKLIIEAKVFRFTILAEESGSSSQQVRERPEMLCVGSVVIPKRELALYKSNMQQR